MEFTMENIKELMDKLVSTNLGELTIKGETGSISIKAKASDAVIQTIQAPQAAAAPTYAPAAPTAPAALAGNVVTSPIVGTFYSAASPGKPPYVKVGDVVSAGDVLFIIESMKLMNEVTSEFSGKVAEILVKDGQAVEFGQPIMRIE